MKRDFNINYYDTKIKKWINVNSLDESIENNFLYKIVDNLQPINMDVLRLKLNFSIFKPNDKLSLIDFSPGSLILNLEDGVDLFWDDTLFNKIRRYILNKRLFTFNPTYFTFNDEINSWTSLNNRIIFSVDRSNIKDDVIRHIMSGAWLLLTGLISPIEFKESLDILRSSFDFNIGYSQDNYVIIRAVPVLSRATT